MGEYLDYEKEQLKQQAAAVKEADKIRQSLRS
jgi:hypothetical protein